MSEILQKLRFGQSLEEPIAIVVAHPDDETVGVGSRLALIGRLRLIHLTDGAPCDLADARRAGFADRGTYAEARMRELTCALDLLGASGADRLAYDYPDQSTIFYVREIAERLANDLASVAAVITHPYEHGHPDHDSAALAVALACRLREERGEEAPLRLEFACYHLEGDEAVFGRFRANESWPETAIELTPDELAVKRAAIACFASQAYALARFPLSPERLRVAQDSDFTRAPGDALYECWGFEMSSRQWRETAAWALNSFASSEKAGRRWTDPSSGETAAT